ncbi:MAG TPA: hypothetical protein DDW24_06130, partial [Blastocatellia bacterium]|nr:hypothetical protein [Blastocatellia bacterium]
MKLGRKALIAVLKENEPGDLSGRLCCSGPSEMEMQPDHLAPWVLAARGERIKDKGERRKRKRD